MTSLTCHAALMRSPVFRRHCSTQLVMFCLDQKKSIGLRHLFELGNRLAFVSGGRTLEDAASIQKVQPQQRTHSCLPPTARSATSRFRPSTSLAPSRSIRLFSAGRPAGEETVTSPSTTEPARSAASGSPAGPPPLNPVC